MTTTERLIVKKPLSIHREVKWVKVADRWTRMSLMTNTSTQQPHEHTADSINFLFIPGNCGNEGYYAEFGRQLIPMVIASHHPGTAVYYYTVSHLNHVKVPASLAGTGSAKSSDCFTLDEQIQHKKDFCEEHLPRSGRLFVFGHSIGCYIALRLMPYLRDNGWDLHVGYMLYPAIERLADTPNGGRLKPMAKFMVKHDRMTRLMYSWLKITPMCVKKCLVRASLRIYGPTPQCVIDAGGESFTIEVMRNVGFITDVEMHQVTDFDETLLEAKEHIRLYYGTDDSWILPEFVDQMRRRLPPGQVLLDQHECHHAFCIKDNEVMAKVVAELVSNETGPVTDESSDNELKVRGEKRSLFSLFTDWLF